MKRETTVVKLSSDREILSVSELTRLVRMTLEEGFSGVWVEGEISNFKYHSSGHMYFSIKDESSQLQCVMFRAENARLGFELTDGMNVLCFGRVSVYPARGQYQLYVERVEPKGAGALQLRFEKLKEKLKLEGLFDEARKRPIPYLPKRVGIVTSADGAALQDILKVLERRFSPAHILVAPVPVQGAQAAPAIAQAIEDLNDYGNMDVLIVTRGGGSLEDLWAFNEEVVARAIYHSMVPVISAVGHEVDFTIADFVSDLRAPTPSAAAELVLPVREELLSRIVELKTRAFQTTSQKIESLRESVQGLTARRALKNPLAVFQIHAQKVDELAKSLRLCFLAVLGAHKETLSGFLGKLEALGPLATLRRGFSVSLVLPGEKIITSFKELRSGDTVQTKLSEGFFISTVKETHA